MKLKIKQAAVFLVFLLCPMLSFAEGGGSETHGDSTVFLTQRNGASGWFPLDLVQDDQWAEEMAKVLRKFRDEALRNGAARVVQLETEPAIRGAFDSMLTDLEQVLPGLSRPMRSNLTQIQWIFVRGRDLPLLSDTGIFEKDYLRKQLGIQFDDTVLVNEDLYRVQGVLTLPSGEVLSTEEEKQKYQAGFFAHEDLIRVVKKGSDRPVSIPLIMKAVRYLMNREYKSDKEAQEFFIKNLGMYFDTRSEAEVREEFFKILEFVKSKRAENATIYQIGLEADWLGLNFGFTPRVYNGYLQQLAANERWNNPRISNGKLAQILADTPRVSNEILALRKAYVPALHNALREFVREECLDQLGKDVASDLLKRGVLTSSIAEKIREQFISIGNPAGLDLDPARVEKAVRVRAGEVSLILKLHPGYWMLSTFTLPWNRWGMHHYSEYWLGHVIEDLRVKQ